ncbi:MAG: archease [Thermoguttaceae bacterium]
MYEIFEHTADVGIRIRAASLDGLFADAARGLLAIMLETPEAVEPRQTVPIRLQADDLEELLHDWLAEVLYTFHAERIALSAFRVTITREDGRPAQLEATARGETLDLARHQVDVEVKAITWHGLTLHPDGVEWVAEVIVDI